MTCFRLLCASDVYVVRHVGRARVARGFDPTLDCWSIRCWIGPTGLACFRLAFRDRHRELGAGEETGKRVESGASRRVVGRAKG